MNVVDATCEWCGQSMTWLTGTPRFHRACWQASLAASLPGDSARPPRRDGVKRRRFLPRRLPRVRIRRRRPKVRAEVLSPEELQVAAQLARERVHMRADLARQAAETVRAALERLRAREQEVARSNPELQPYLATYFEQSRQALLRTTGDLLAPTRTIDQPEVVRTVPSPESWLRRLDEPVERKDPRHGPA